MKVTGCPEIVTEFRFALPRKRHSSRYGILESSPLAEINNQACSLLAGWLVGCSLPTERLNRPPFPPRGGSEGGGEGGSGEGAESRVPSVVSLCLSVTAGSVDAIPKFLSHGRVDGCNAHTAFTLYQAR